jgi:SAM-dependent methyltransferase
VTEPTVKSLDTGTPHSARLWNYWLGGKDNFQADRDAGDAIAGMLPSIVALAREDRKFLRRSVEHLVRDGGIRQILDIGTGLPTADNTHQVAQRAAPETRVVYVDNDPLVLVHARALLQGTEEGATTYVEADLNDPESIMRAARETLDFSQPIALSLVALLHLVADEDEPTRIVRELLDALAPGSYVTLSHATGDFDPETWERVVEVYRKGGTAAQVRSHAEFSAFFTGLDLLDPGVVLAALWHPELGEPQGGEEIPLYVGIGRKP